jgi:hypothetical protein
MSVDIDKAAAQHVINLATAFEDNCRLKNGIPGPSEKLRVGEAQAAAPVVVAPPAIPQPAPASPASDWLKNLAIGSIGLTSLGGLGLGAYNAMRPTGTTVIQQPAPQQPSTGSLYQYLQDGGYHVPPADK